MKIHHVYQFEWPDGSMSKPMHQTTVFEKPPTISCYARTGTGIQFSPAERVQVGVSGLLRIYYQVLDSDEYNEPDNSFDLCFEQTPDLDKPECELESISMTNGHLLFKTPNTPGHVTVEVLLSDKYGALSNKVKFEIDIVET